MLIRTRFKGINVSNQYRFDRELGEEKEEERKKKKERLELSKWRRRMNDGHLPLSSSEMMDEPFFLKSA